LNKVEKCKYFTRDLIVLEFKNQSFKYILLTVKVIAKKAEENAFMENIMLHLQKVESFKSLIISVKILVSDV
jgi:hypothetical protein